jgi:hypothetical protein
MIFEQYFVEMIFEKRKGLSWSWSYGSMIYNCLCNQCLSPLKLWVRILLMARCTDSTIYDKVCHWLATGQWFSLGTPVSSTNLYITNNNEFTVKKSW